MSAASCLFGAGCADCGSRRAARFGVATGFLSRRHWGRDMGAGLCGLPLRLAAFRASPDGRFGAPGASGWMRRGTSPRRIAFSPWHRQIASSWSALSKRRKPKRLARPARCRSLRAARDFDSRRIARYGVATGFLSRRHRDAKGAGTYSLRPAIAIQALCCRRGR